MPIQAKPREELPWLPYWSKDSVRIINSHGGGGSPVITIPDLAGWWCPSLDSSGQGTTTLFDLSGGGNNGTLTNMDAGSDWVLSDSKYALDLDGSNDHVPIAGTSSLVSGLSAVSFSFWFRADSFGNAWSTMFGHRGSDVTYANLVGFNSTSGAIDFRINNNGANTTGTFTASLSTWYHVAAVYNGSTQKIYIDGTEKASVAKSGTLSQSVNIAIGYDTYLSGREFDGLLDDLKIYSRGLTSGEVTTLAAGRGVA